MKFINTAAILLLVIFTVLAVTSMWNDNANYDERIHLPAGYSYLIQQDMRLNPEHPPLVKDLAALPLLFMKVNFPYESPGWNTALSINKSRTPVWQTDVTFGNDLLYYSGNDAQKMMRYGRISIILIGILLGFYIFRFTRELWGNLAAIMALVFYSFSPTVLAHTRLVTTDIAAATAFFISFYYLYHWLKLPTKKNVLILGIVLGLTLLTKFSTFLLLPIFGLIILIYSIFQNKEKLLWIKKYSGGFILVLITAFLIVGAVYTFHIWNYPASKQAVDTTFILSTFGFKPLADFNTWLSSRQYLRAYGHYLLGFLMVLQRSEGGNTTYYLGTTGVAGSWTYFPLVYLIKEPLAYIILLFFAIFLANKNWRKNFIISIKNHPVETGMLIVIIIYWIFSIRSRLNIGVRHILPTLPFIYALTARQLSSWASNYKIRKIFIATLMVWAIFSVISIWPSFLSYFNEVAGGPDNGYKFVVDSNIDWGQDILRLSKFIEKNNIKEIKMDYFSGAPAEYYIKTAKIESYNRELPQKGWLAVSATIFQGACRGDKIPCYYNERAYTWLDQYKPVAKIGYSVFVYKIE